MTAPPANLPSVLMVATVAATVGGFLTPLARHIRALGWHVEAAANGVSGDQRVLDAFDAAHDLPMSRSLLDLPALARSERAVAGLIEQVRPDVVHVHTPIAAFLVRLAVRLMPAHRRPAVVYTAHGFHFFAGGRRLSNAVFLTAERLAGRWTDRLIVINDEDELAARQHRLVSSRRLVRMPGVGLDTEWYSPLAEDPDPSGSPTFVVVGEFTPNKRQADALRALALMRHTNARLVLLGDGPTRPALEALRAELGLESRVDFAGMVADVRPTVRGATALILSSAREGLARSIMEALAMGVPVAASTARGNAELVQDGGFLLPVGDISGLANALDWFIDHPDEAREMGRRGRRRMVEQYEIGLVLQQHEALYRAVLEERAGGQGGRVPGLAEAAARRR